MQPVVVAPIAQAEVNEYEREKRQFNVLASEDDNVSLEDDDAAETLERIKRHHRNNYSQG